MYGLDPASWSGGRGATYRLLFSDEIECEPASMGQKQQAETNKQGTAQQQEEILLPRIRWIVDEKFDPQSTSNDESGKKNSRRRTTPIGIDKKPKGDDISTPKKFHQKSRNLRGKKESFSRQRTTQIGNRQETNRGGDNPTQRNSTEDQETTTKSTTRTSNSSQQTGDSTQRFQISKPKRSAGILESLGRAPDSLARSHETHREREREVPRGVVSLWGYW